VGGNFTPPLAILRCKITLDEPGLKSVHFLKAPTEITGNGIGAIISEIRVNVLIRKMLKKR